MMFRHQPFQYRPHLPLAKLHHASWTYATELKFRLTKRRASDFVQSICPSTPDSLYKILHSRSTFVRPWTPMTPMPSEMTIGGPDNDIAIAELDGFLSPEGVYIQYSRKGEYRYPIYVQNALRLHNTQDRKKESFLDFLINYIEWDGIYVLGREDDSPLQPHMWEIPKGTKVPPSLRLTASRWAEVPQRGSRLTLGPAFPMSLDCLNRRLEQFMLDYGRVTPLRHWFTPEQDFCKVFPNQTDFMRKEEMRLKSKGRYSDKGLRKEREEREKEEYEEEELW